MEEEAKTREEKGAEDRRPRSKGQDRELVKTGRGSVSQVNERQLVVSDRRIQGHCGIPLAIRGGPWP